MSAHQPASPATDPSEALSAAAPESRPDPLLIAAQVLLYALLAGIVLGAIALLVGLFGFVSAHGVPWRTMLGTPAWRPVTDTLFALCALWILADIVLALLAMIGAVGRGAAFEPANVSRLERIAAGTIGLAVLGIVAEIVGSGISGSINGFDIAVDLPASIGFALLIFILARVFRQGAAMQSDLEGTV